MSNGLDQILPDELPGRHQGWLYYSNGLAVPLPLKPVLPQKRRKGPDKLLAIAAHRPIDSWLGTYLMHL
jgi:hypothetical protein